jgi:hypothetical protein
LHARPILGPAFSGKRNEDGVAALPGNIVMFNEKCSFIKVA